MNIHEIACGNQYTLELVPESGADFGRLIQPKVETRLVFPEGSTETFLSFGGQTHEAKGAHSSATRALADVRHRNLPRICWVASATPKGKPIERLTVQVHEFPKRVDFPEPMEIGVDDKLIEHLAAKVLLRKVEIDDATKWLAERFLLSGADGSQSRFFISALSKQEAGRPSAFRLLGHGYALDVSRGENDRLRAIRLVKGGGQGNNPVILAQGNASFRDATVAGEFRGVARTQLDLIVQQADSYLGLWKEYNELERRNILARVREFDYLNYTKCERLGNGHWRFHLRNPVNEIEECLGLLRDGNDQTLEAAEEPPPELINPADAIARPGDNSDDDLDSEFLPRPGKSGLIGEFKGTDSSRRAIDLDPGDDNDREPPEQGVIFLSWNGDKKRLERRIAAHQAITHATCPMPQLGLLIEGRAVPAREGRSHSALSPKARDVFGGEPTQRQQDALERALNTPDIALIQGPPGTGKTRTIAALQVRLAEIDESEALAGQTLLTSYQHDAVDNAASRTEVYGLPAIKVGQRRGQKQEDDGVDKWRRERADAVRSALTNLPEIPATRAYKEVSSRVAAYLARPQNRGESLKLAREVTEIGGGWLAPELKDRLLTIEQQLSRTPGMVEGIDTDDRALALKAVRGIRIEAVSFMDDGRSMAAKAKLRIERIGLFDAKRHEALARAAEWDLSEAPPFLADLKRIQEEMIDQLVAVPVADAPMAHGDLQELLNEVVAALHTRAREAAGGEVQALYEYLHDLDSDPESVREAIKTYTAVLAATNQQAASYAMFEAKGGVGAFSSVVVDEAARSNPLDLLIPMARAERRIVLVGDHRQLPHILEPDLEKELNQSASEQTREALKRSLFQRLWDKMKELEAKDGLRRTVTLNTQYRMHPVLGRFVSDTFYAPYGEGYASPESPLFAEELRHDLPGYEGRVAAWVDIPNARGGEKGNHSKLRKAEAEWIAKEVKRLGDARPDLSFGVISFYSAQVAEVMRAMEPHGLTEKPDDGPLRISDHWKETRNREGRIVERLRVGTVDAFQGKEFDVVFLSMTRSNTLPVSDEASLRTKFGHIMLPNRMCVAMSRQQRLLVVVGDAGMLNGEAAKRELDGLVKFHQLCGGEHGIIRMA